MSAGTLGAAAELGRDWASAAAGDRTAQERWQVDEGGEWSWEPDGVVLRGAGWQWSALGWLGWDAAAVSELRNFVAEVTISGSAEAAGLSFGPYKDFLVPVTPATGPRRLQLEVDAAAGHWTLRVDGQLLTDNCWAPAVERVEDILWGRLSLKTRDAAEARFEELHIGSFEASCQISVIITCQRYLQRLRVALRNWCRQESPSGSYEVLVVNPHSPDGTHEHLAAVARSHPHIRLRELPVEPALAHNKGAMINRAVQVSRGTWLWLTDADCVFGPSSAAVVLDRLDGAPERLLYGQRRYLTMRQTDALLSGSVDAVGEFDALCGSASARAAEHAPWGYTQIVHRSTLERVPYREDFDHFAHSDGRFVDDCQNAGITFESVDNLVCLHLEHPFSWYGTDGFL
jgi:hypothetical protein